MGGVFSRPPPQRARVPTDEVLPTHLLDDTVTNRSLVMGWVMRFDDILSAEMLHAALVRLLDMGEWRKLGGRLRQNQENKLEIHVPTKFTPERPSVRFSQANFETSADEHPSASRFPKPTECLSLQPAGDKFRDLYTDSDTPETLSDFLSRDVPMMSLRVTTFTDATFVGLSWPHPMTDGMGRQALMKAWCSVLAGREVDVPPLLGVREDPLAEVGVESDDNGEAYVLADREMTGLGFIRFAIRFAWNMFWVPQMEPKVIFLPARFVASLRQQAMDQLAAHARDVGGEPPFVSEGDVLAAWATRLVATSQPTRPIVAVSAVDLRSRLKGVFDSRGVYVMNLISGFFTQLPSKISSPAAWCLGTLAASTRASIAEQMTDTQIRCSLRRSRPALTAQRQPSAYFDPASVLVIFSNWTKAKFSEIVDFSPAIVKASEKPEEKRLAPLGKMTVHLPIILRHAIATRNTFNIAGKDFEGNYWMLVYLPPDVLVVLQEEVDRCNGEQ